MFVDDLDQFEVISEPTSIRGGGQWSISEFNDFISFIEEQAKTSDSSNTKSINYIYTRSTSTNGETTSYTYSNQSSSS